MRSDHRSGMDSMRKPPCGNRRPTSESGTGCTEHAFAVLVYPNRTGIAAVVPLIATWWTRESARIPGHHLHRQGEFVSVMAAALRTAIRRPHQLVNPSGALPESFRRPMAHPEDASRSPAHEETLAICRARGSDRCGAVDRKAVDAHMAWVTMEWNTRPSMCWR